MALPDLDTLARVARRGLAAQDLKARVEVEADRQSRSLKVHISGPKVRFWNSEEDRVVLEPKFSHRYYLNREGLATYGIWVLPQYRHQGLGRKLLAAAELVALQFGCSRIIADNPDDAAYHFWWHMGYKGDFYAYELIKELQSR